MESIPKIDVHHHIIPPQLTGVTHGLKGMKAPEWSMSSDKAFSEAIGVRTAILSTSTPGVTHISDPEESAATARAMNEYCASLRDSEPEKYGFFATLPSLEHTDLALAEIRHAYDVLRADGVTLFTSYATATGYLGHGEWEAVWAELNRRRAVVFVHPINNKYAVYFDERLPMPAFDWPHETGRAAMDLILNRRLLQFPDVRIILSHGGGTLSALVKRATLISLPEFGAVITADEILKQAKMFYFDLALCGSAEMLPLILNFAEKDHLLFGSDFPHATTGFSQLNNKFIQEYDGFTDEKRKEVYYAAALKLFPRLAAAYPS